MERQPKISSTIRHLANWLISNENTAKMLRMANQEHVEQRNHPDKACEDQALDYAKGLESGLQNLVSALHQLKEQGHDITSIRYFPDPPFSREALLALVKEETKWIKKVPYEEFLEKRERPKSYTKRWSMDQCLEKLRDFLQYCTETSSPTLKKNYEAWREVYFAESEHTKTTPSIYLIERFGSWDEMKQRASKIATNTYSERI